MFLVVTLPLFIEHEVFHALSIFVLEHSFVAVWLATPLKGSDPTTTPTLQSDVHATGREFVQRVGLSLPQV